MTKESSTAADHSCHHELKHKTETISENVSFFDPLVLFILHGVHINTNYLTALNEFRSL